MHGSYGHGISEFAELSGPNPIDLENKECVNYYYKGGKNSKILVTNHVLRSTWHGGSEEFIFVNVHGLFIFILLIFGINVFDK